MRGCTACGRIYAPSHVSSICAECGTTLSAMPVQEVMGLVRMRQARLRAEFALLRARVEPDDLP